jgi:hypothetical protein
MRRHRALATGTAVVLLLGVVGLAGFATVLAEKNGEPVRTNRELDRQLASFRTLRDQVQADSFAR